MLLLRKIILTHFKNYDSSPFDFTGNVVAISGLNGIGKTNLLDAIYYCCFTKSYFSASDAMNVNFEKEGFRLEAHFEKEGAAQKVICINRGNNKKEISVNDVLYEKAAGHVGSLPAVIIAPDDIEIIIGGSEGRRRYLDSVICQLDNNYMQQLMIYNKVMQQRNSLFKRAAEQGSLDRALLEILNGQLTAPAKIIFEKRMLYTEKLIPMIETLYHFIADNNEEIKFVYKSSLQDDPFEHILKKNEEKDRILQRTSSGIHKDNLFFSLNGQPFKNIASQGQRKSLLFALKLAQYRLLKDHNGFSPVLLLDDVFEKLDQQRMHRLLQMVCKENEGQVFITDTHKERLHSVFEELSIKAQMIEL